ncbi:protein of unknown function [Parapedobacter composti]|uniref:Ferric-dicitrate binding protein FerR, regulates iron transport through sigma-19 n=1 Tax=Parapedobacter composti TaxID=623281 RepID=A0A1I1HN57_9SPHI|nr:FecR domain-containing protein [Parapedobacter composti]SFC25394.1 protein of unknown function [Parapedobacter composti]
MEKRIRYLIELFWRDEATDEERKELLGYLEYQHEAWRDELLREFQVSDDSRNPIDPVRADELFSLIQSKAGITPNPPKPIIQRLRPFIRVAVAAAVVVLCWNVYRAVSVRDALPLESNSIAVLDTVSNTNDGDNPTTISLEDGTVVYLSPGSSIAYVKGFSDASREIDLNGEARFDVARDTLRPFTVRAKGYTTTALGTSFVVNTAVPNRIFVKLLTGKVVVRATEQSGVILADIYLKPGEELNINELSGRWSVSQKTPAPIINDDRIENSRVVWEEKGRLMFNKAPLKEVFARIAASHGQTVDLASVRLDGLTFTGTFEPTDSLHVMLNVICNMNDLTYEDDNGKLRIRNK